jgi:hypothetical protein
MLLEEVASQTELATRLERLRIVAQYGNEHEPESERLVTSLAHLEESFNTYLNELLPSLLGAANDEELEDALHNIGMELQHVAWHMRDPKYFELFIRETE